jgi:hypothetical protein
MAKSERLMTKKREIEMRRQIFSVVTEFRDDNGARLRNGVDGCHELADGLFHALKAKGLLNP